MPMSKVVEHNKASPMEAENLGSDPILPGGSNFWDSRGLVLSAVSFLSKIKWESKRVVWCLD